MFHSITILPEHGAPQNLPPVNRLRKNILQYGVTYTAFDTPPILIGPATPGKHSERSKDIVFIPVQVRPLLVEWCR
jgi:hypothetical protein